jgi:ABC-type sugar transport system ATPase subunit
MPAVRFRSVTKRFPGVLALDDVSLDVAEGSFHALCGENGAGKSTLGKILAGIYQADAGGVELFGRPLSSASPEAALAAGIGMVHQELAFCENLSVAENLCLRALPHRAGFVSRRAMHREAGHGARVIVFDEPTSSLSQHEALRLYALIDRLKARGVTGIYVTHRMEEIFRLCDTVSVLRDGRHVATRPAAELDTHAIVEMMIGRRLEESVAGPDTGADGPEVLRVTSFSSPAGFRDVSLSVRAGEVVGLGGLVGAGRSEVARALFGLDPRAAGTIEIGGRPVDIRSPREAMELGIGLVPEDRKRQGLVLQMTALANATLAVLPALSRLTLVRRAAERAIGQRYFDELSVRAPGLDAVVGGLSGGNQQKIVLAKWLAANCRVLILDEPTRGVDVGAKAQIHAIVEDLAARGVGILLISSELPELLRLSSRIVVLRDGQVAGEVARTDATQELLMRLMAGVAA